MTDRPILLSGGAPSSTVCLDHEPAQMLIPRSICEGGTQCMQHHVNISIEIKSHRSPKKCDIVIELALKFDTLQVADNTLAERNSGDPARFQKVPPTPGVTSRVPTIGYQVRNVLKASRNVFADCNSPIKQFCQSDRIAQQNKYLSKHRIADRTATNLRRPDRVPQQRFDRVEPTVDILIPHEIYVLCGRRLVGLLHG